MERPSPMRMGVASLSSQLRSTTIRPGSRKSLISAVPWSPHRYQWGRVMKLQVPTSTVAVMPLSNTMFMMKPSSTSSLVTWVILA